jgi:ethanolamine utilization protein EutN
MILARVIGSVWATVKDPGLVSRKLLILQPITPSREPTGEPLIAVDGAGVGVGEEVFYVKGREGSYPFLPAVVPTDAGIVGKLDSIEVPGAADAGPEQP